MSPQHDASLLFSGAKNLLVCNGDPETARAIASHALDIFETSGMLRGLSTRNQVLRLGDVLTLQDYARRHGGDPIDWRGLPEMFGPELISAILMADGITFLDTMLSLDAPIGAMDPPVMRYAYSHDDPEVLAWLTDAIALKASPVQSALRLLDACLNCTPRMARGLPRMLRRHIPACASETNHVSSWRLRPGGAKIAAIAILSGMPPEACARLHALSDGRRAFRELVAMGMSRHGQLEMHRREPDLAAVIERSKNASFCGVQE